MSILHVDGDDNRVITSDLATSLPWVDVRAFGAVGDGETDDTDAIKAAIAYAVSFKESIQGLTRIYDQVPRIYFPRGQYLITEKHALDPVLAVFPDPVESLRGFHLFGDGPYATRIIFDNDSSDTDNYLIYNKDKYAFSSIADLSIVSTNANERFCYLESTGSDGRVQEIAFRRVYLQGFTKGIVIGGSNNTSELHFDNCYFETYSTTAILFDSANVNAVNLTFLGCSLILADSAAGGSIFKFTAGGSLSIVGCNIIVGGSATLLDLSGSNIGPNSCDYGFYGTRVELRNNSRLVAIDAADAEVTFERCNLTVGDTYAGSSGRVYINNRGHVTFRDCPLLKIAINPIELETDGNGYSLGYMAFVLFDNCTVNDDIASMVTITYTGGGGGAYGQGRVKVINSQNVVPGASPGYHKVPVDVDFNFEQGAFDNHLMTRKSYLWVNNSAFGLPCGSGDDVFGSDANLTLPLGAVVTKITMYLSAANGPAYGNLTYTGEVRSHDGNTTFLTLAGPANADKWESTSDPLWYRITSSSERNLKVRGKIPDGSPNADGLTGWVLVEYY